MLVSKISVIHNGPYTIFVENGTLNVYDIITDMCKTIILTETWTCIFNKIYLFEIIQLY